MKKLIYQALVLVLVLGLVLSITTPAFANPGPLNYNPARYPSTGEADVAAGGSISFNFSITADNGTDKTYVPGPYDTISPYIELPTAWLSFSPSSLVLSSGQTGITTVTITVPSGATPGVYAKKIKFNPQSTPASSPGTGVDVYIEVSANTPALTIDKQADVTETYEGKTISYIYLVKNTGDVDLTAPIVTDSNFDVTVEAVLNGNTYNIGDTGDDNIFSVDEIWEFTATYTVPWFTAGPVQNTGTATAEYKSEPISDDDYVSVIILHDPAIKVTKSGPDPIGYFKSVDASYNYEITNTGNCSLNVALTDDQIGSPAPVDIDEDGFNDGDINKNSHLDPDDPATAESDAETWYYTAKQFIDCTGDTILEFVNIVTATGEDATGAIVDDQDCWTVIIFQWLPRTIGYWGNWTNHWSDICMTDLVNRVNNDSAYFTGLTASDLKTILLASDQTGKMTLDKARILVRKQLMAAWLSAESYIGATDGNMATCGLLDSAIDPGSTVYVSKITGAEALFGSTTKTVAEILDAVDAGMNTWTQNQLLVAKDVLDKMNNAENNGYYMFMDPTFDPSTCP